MPDGDRVVIGVIPPGDSFRVLTRVFDEQEFLSPFGLRGLSKYHEEHPVFADLDGTQVSVDYEPAESTTGMFGGNSNWRGPVWMPVNYLVLRACSATPTTLGSSHRDRVPHGKRPDRRARRLRRGSPPASDLAVPARPRRPPAVPRLGRQAPRRPALARQHRVQRVLPRRQRIGSRRHPPDRMDRARGRPHLPSRSLRRAVTSRRATLFRRNAGSMSMPCTCMLWL